MIGPQHPVSQLLHRNKYRSDGESFDDYAVRYARTLADDEKHFRHLLGGLREQRILPAGRQQLAIGRPHQTTAYNCFCGGIIPDSMAGIMTELKNSALTLRAGGGCGWDFSTLRPEKDPIYGLGPGAFASGPVGFMPLWHAMCSSIMSAGMRRGAMMGSVSCHHPDIMKFVRAKRVPPELTPIFEAIRELPDGPIRKAAEKAAQRLLPLTNFNISVGCTDAFMDAVENDGLYDLTFGGRVYQRVRALDVWAVIMENNWDWAEPGVLFFDRINQMNPLRYCEYILSTNPCFTGDTEVLTREGYRRLDTLNGQTAQVWNGAEWSRVETRITGTDQPILAVELSNGVTLRCTPYHRFLTEDGDREAKDLQEGMALEFFPMPLIEGGGTLENAYAQGVFAGDGSWKRNRAEVWLYGEKKRLLPLLPYDSVNEYQRADGDTRLHVLLSGQFFDKDFVPGPEYSVQSRLDWLAGLADTDGTAVRWKNATGEVSSIALHIASVDKSFLLRTRKMLTTLGVNPVVGVMHEAGDRLMPDGKGGQAEYACQECYRLQVNAWDLRKLQDLGLQTNRLKLENNNPARSAARKTRIVSVRPAGVADKVYCFNEPLAHRGTFEGVIAGNCAEQPLPPFGACLLGSLNLVKYLVPTYSRILHPHTANGKPPTGEHHSRYIRGYEMDLDLFRDDVRATVRAFDNVIENTVYPLPEQEAEAKAKRRMGVGITGMANALEVCGHVYGTPAYLEAQESILAILRDTAYETSIDLAREKGSFPLFDADKWLASGFAQTLPEHIRERIKREGLRNGLLLSIAPTGCQRPDTMVVTEDGILELHELGQLAGPQWQPLGLAVCADRGQPIASRFYNNGIVDTVTLSMRSGVHLEATPTHRYRAIRDGSYIWLRCDEVVEGDRLVVAIGGYNKGATAEPVLAAVGQLHGNEQLIRQPEKASPLLGWFLGVYFANGSDHRKGVRIAFNSSQDKWRKVQRVATELFGFEPTVEDNGRGCLSIYLSRQSLKRWLAANGLTKGRSRSICVPILVRRMSRESLAAFVEGYFYGDGTIQFPDTPHPVRCVATASPVMARQLAVIIRALGNDVSCDGYVSGMGSWIHRVRIVHGCRKDERREDRQVLDRLGLGHCTVDCVVAVGHGRCLTLDLEVPEGNTYLANGVVSHNTISLTADNISSGIEPPFALELEREINLAEGRTTVAFNDYAFDRFGVKGRTAMECTPQDHIRVLCSAQKYIDSSCSKTCNVNGARGGDVQPGEITFQEFKELYWLAWKGGAKGCTTYNANGQRVGILTAKAQSGNLRGAAQTPTSVRSGNGETAHDGADTEGAACFLDPTTGIKSCDS